MKIAIVKGNFRDMEYDQSWVQETTEWLEVSEAEATRIESHVHLLNSWPTEYRVFRFVPPLPKEPEYKSFIEALEAKIKKQEEKDALAKKKREQEAAKRKASEVERKKKQLDKLKKELGEH